MKKLLLITAFIAGLGLAPAFAQFGPPGGGKGPQLGGAINKLFGANKAFSGRLEMEVPAPTGGNITIAGKFNFDSGNSRFEVNVSEVKGGGIPASALQQIKTMGMDTVVTITRQDLKATYMIYPGLKSYASMPPQDANASANLDDYKQEVAEQGKEAVDGHDCVKNKVTVSGKDGVKHEFTVWNATDLKNFPLKIEAQEDGQTVTMHYQELSFDKPAASLFDAPAGFTKYTDMQTMMQAEVMKRMGGAAGMPPQKQ